MTQLQDGNWKRVDAAHKSWPSMSKDELLKELERIRAAQRSADQGGIGGATGVSDVIGNVFICPQHGGFRGDTGCVPCREQIQPTAAGGTDAMNRRELLAMKSFDDLMRQFIEAKQLLAAKDAEIAELKRALGQASSCGAGEEVWEIGDLFPHRLRFGRDEDGYQTVLEPCDSGPYLTTAHAFSVAKHLIDQREELLDALRTIQYALSAKRLNAVPGWTPMREWLNKHDVYNDDLSGDRVILAVVDTAIKKAAAEQKQEGK